MLENEARFYWRTSLALRLKLRRGAQPPAYEDEMTEMEAMVMHSKFAAIRTRAAAAMVGVVAA